MNRPLDAQQAIGYLKFEPINLEFNLSTLSDLL